MRFTEKKQLSPPESLSGREVDGGGVPGQVPPLSLKRCKRIGADKPVRTSFVRCQCDIFKIGRPVVVTVM